MGWGKFIDTAGLFGAYVKYMAKPQHPDQMMM